MNEMPPTKTRARSGGRAARRALRATRDFTMLPGLTRKIPNCEVMDQEQVEKIDAASMDILENIGIQFRDPIALEDWRRAGAKVEGEMVYLDRGLVRDLISTIPEHFTYAARNPANNVALGGKHSVFVPTSGPPFIRDLDDVRRIPTIADLNMMHQLAHMMPALHSTGHHIVEPCDIPVSHRHLHITYSSMKYSDKMYMGMGTSPKNAEDVMDMSAILFGDEFIDQNPVTTCNCNGNSPLLWDETMLGAMRAFCRRNQPVLCSPFALGGANTPASVPATVAQLNAEALAALAYTQLIRRGCPAIYGNFVTTVSMKSGAPMSGTPEVSLMAFMIGQMARYYKIPWRSTSTIAGAKLFDAQAGYESATTLSAVVHAGANYIWHAAGWNEAGMVTSVSKFLVDSEQCAMIYRMAEGPKWDDFDRGLEALADVGPGGHFLGHPHTQEVFQTAFFMPELLDNNAIEQWQAEGEKDTNTRGLELARKLLGEYQEPKMDVAKEEELLAYIARREREIPAVEELNQEF